MTLGHFLSQMGIGSKQLTERLAHGEYAAGHESPALYAHEPAAHGSHLHHVAASKHHHGGGGGGGHKSNSAAMSALTLLAFLFFLHILQQCLREHMAAMATPQVVVMTGGREGEDPLAKTALAAPDKHGGLEANGPGKTKDDPAFESDGETTAFTKVQTAEHTPQLGDSKYSGFGNSNRKSYPGLVSALGG